ncbi:MAG: SpoIIE family protein phosphatase [Thioalkalispiraceae bacterium]|jgi:sigma-B regulation protein RsbU (phosphoserine phosphatase)
MQEKLLEQIKALSNSKLGHMTALETFARCLRSVYGKCSFISFESDPKADRHLVRLIFSDREEGHAQLDNLVGQAIPIQSEQLHHITSRQVPIVEELDPVLEKVLVNLGLPAKSMMAIPLYLDGEIKRWVLILGEEAGQFAKVELEQAILLANLAGTYMARIDETEALEQANEWIEKELDEIARIQKLLLPQETIRIKGVEVATFYSACDKAGGDYYDIANLSEMEPPVSSDEKYDAWGVIVADAAGHGAAAAVEISMLDAILRTYQGDGEQGAANVFNYANRHFFTRISRGAYITASIVGFNPVTSSLFYANAGHPPVLVITPDKRIEYLNENTGIPLGVDPDWQWENSETNVEPGSVIISLTDGILEALSPEKEQFGLQRVEDAVLQIQGTAQDYLNAIVQAVTEHQAGHAQADDQAIVVIKIEE